MVNILKHDGFVQGVQKALLPLREVELMETDKHLSSAGTECYTGWEERSNKIFNFRNNFKDDHGLLIVESVAQLLEYIEVSNYTVIDLVD